MNYAKPPYFQSHSKNDDGMYTTKVYNKDQVLCTMHWCGEKTDEHTTTSKRVGTAELFRLSPEMLEALKDLQERVIRCRTILEDGHGGDWNILDTKKSESLLKELK